MKRMTAAAAVVASVLVVTGCSSSSDSKGGQTGGNPGAGKEERARADAEAQARAKDEAAMKDAAVRYTKASVGNDVRTMCGLMTPNKQGDGGLEGCVKNFQDRDGEKPDAVGTVTTEGGPLTVPPVKDHPEGTGLMVTEKTADGARTSSYRWAVRLVKNDGTWLVDQFTHMRDEDMSAASPVRSALMRSSG
ncbi:hypothetical protein ACH427_13290 [Streptomyces sp. NPDC020379]|uniref:hypothetical protein n=1 Tax=Streptomyces sp. NPDC020379 TaxID=3365071 RepID=UPI0037B82593